MRISSSQQAAEKLIVTNIHTQTQRATRALYVCLYKPPVYASLTRRRSQRAAWGWLLLQGFDACAASYIDHLMRERRRVYNEPPYIGMFVLPCTRWCTYACEAKCRKSAFFFPWRRAPAPLYIYLYGVWYRKCSLRGLFNVLCIGCAARDGRRFFWK